MAERGVFDSLPLHSVTSFSACPFLAALMAECGVTEQPDEAQGPRHQPAQPAHATGHVLGLSQPISPRAL